MSRQTLRPPDVLPAGASHGGPDGLASPGWESMPLTRASPTSPHTGLRRCILRYGPHALGPDTTAVPAYNHLLLHQLTRPRAELGVAIDESRTAGRELSADV